MPVGFKINNTEFETEYVRREFFQEGNLWAWGKNTIGDAKGALGDNTTTSKSSPVQTVAGGVNWKEVQRLGSFTQSCAGIKTDGTLWMWGLGGGGNLGNNSASDQISPVQTVAGGTNWKQVSTGGSFTAAIKTDGTLWTWGGGGVFGALGDNTQTNRSSPIQTIAGGNNWKQVSCSVISTGAIKTDGTLWTWGHNNQGQLGDNTTTNKSSPIQTIAGGNNWKQVSTGGNDMNGVAAAIKTDGTLWTWGNNTFGQLGDNTITNKLSPVQTVAGGNNWKQVSVGDLSCGAIKTDGTLWTWGRNNVGQLGNNDSTDRSSPIQTIAGGTNWKQLSLGGFVSATVAAIKTDGTLWTWGRNNYGQLGDNTLINRVSPVQTITGGNNWKHVSVGTHFTAAIRHIS